MSSNFVEQENFLNTENGTSGGIDVAATSKRSIMDRFFYSKNPSKKAQQHQQQDEMVDFKLEPLSGAAINLPTSENKLEPRMKWDSISEYVLSIIGFVIDLGNVWR
jgi:hypothetical protein